MAIFIWPAAILIGGALALFGAGGGMITVPALLYLLDMPVKEAIAMALWVVAFVSFGTFLQQKAWKTLQVKLVLTFGLTGMMGSSAGALFATLLSETVQTLLFAFLLLLVTLWLSRIEMTDRVSIFRFIPASVAGLGIGFLTGILGVGGGFLLVPALIYLGIGHFPTAVGHSLILITANAVAGGLTYLGTVSFSLVTALAISVCALIGSVLGGYFLVRISSARLKDGFNVLMIGIGISMIVKAMI